MLRQVIAQSRGSAFRETRDEKVGLPLISHYRHNVIPK
jgi:hypothetical protein